LLIALVMVALAGLYIGLPLLRHDDRATVDSALLQKQGERLLVYYERVLTNIRDLDEDHAAGKITDQEYQTERESWMQRGIEVLKALDHLHHTSILPATPPDDAAIDQAVDEAIETAVAARRARALLSADELH